MRGITHKILARADGRRRTSIVTRTAALGSTAAAVLLGIGLSGHSSASTAATAAASTSTSSASGAAGHSAAATSSRSTLRAPVTKPTSTTKRSHVRSGGS